jgi:hypothetical protein
MARSCGLRLSSSPFLGAAGTEEAVHPAKEKHRDEGEAAPKQSTDEEENSCVALMHSSSSAHFMTLGIMHSGVSVECTDEEVNA